MESSIVIKVKYGKTLRRFNARVADDKFGLNIDGLRDKIFQLFNFPPGSELTLTYIDEDGDVVTLVDDEDLQDITRQDLDPLRISVQLNTKELSRSSGSSSGSSTFFRAPLIQPTFPDIKSSVSDFLMSLPESKSRKILKHSADIVSKASSAAQEIAVLSKALSMTGLSFLKQAGPVSGVTTGSVRSGEPSQAEIAEELTLKTAGKPKNHTGSIDASKLKSSQPAQNGIQCESLSKSPKPKSSLAGGKKEEGNKFGDCHLVGKALGISYSSASATGPVKRSHNHSERKASIFHRGVRCDGCGVHPITGPRFKSKVKEDYDLCSICFAQMGNDADYIRRDIYRGSGVKSPKLDSRFTQDVNVLDGTIMAPLTPFTKVWRMRNNGNIVWPQGTQLVWIGGDRLSDAFSVELQITSVGLAVDHDLDVAVDFTAPALPGRYISYWRMAFPSGEKFGQRVWVLIQVDLSKNPPKKEFFYEASQDLDLNFPPASFHVAGSETIHASADMTKEDIIPAPMELFEPAVDGSRNKELDSKSCISPSAAGSPISNPIDLSEEALAVTSAAPPSVAKVQASSQGGGENSDIEMTLKELEDMGFKQVNLNKEVLRMNEYDLEQAVDDLCGVSEWDPILEELEVMGFRNKAINKKLLKKNNGSIRRVVMDLIDGEN